MKKEEATRILRAAGNWAEGMSDQGDSSMRVAVVLDVSKMPRDRVEQVREALQVYAGSSTVREGMGHPVTGTRKTIGLEAIPGNQGMRDVLNLTDGPLRGSLFRWDDDHRDWVRSHGHDITLQQAGGARKEAALPGKSSRVGLLWAGATALAVAAAAALFSARSEREPMRVEPVLGERPAPPTRAAEIMPADPHKPFNLISTSRREPAAEAGFTAAPPKTVPPKNTL
jgi:hypothetical protein